eukprot:767036-Prorocentrum_minimum.AAC.2
MAIGTERLGGELNSTVLGGLNKGLNVIECIEIARGKPGGGSSSPVVERLNKAFTSAVSISLRKKPVAVFFGSAVAE